MSRNPAPRVFTFSIGDKPILAFEANMFMEASQLCKEKWLHNDLVQLTSNGAPVWDGKAKLTIRNAIESEIAQYVSAAAAAKTADGELCLAYLVELDHP